MKQRFIGILLFLIPNILASEHFWTETYTKAINGFWGPSESVSGPGSSKEQTIIIRQKIEQLLTTHSITSILDVPCGDFYWMKRINLKGCFYTGCDIVKPLIEKNKQRYGDSRHTFLHLDATKDALPYADLIICRDLLVHLSLSDIYKVLRNFKKSGAKYLLTTTFFFNRDDTNSDIVSGGWRTLNLQLRPFNFPTPKLVINEGCTEQDSRYKDKSLALWDLDTINL